MISSSLAGVRSCPVCGGRPVGIKFPYSTCFDGVIFNYFGCGGCQSVFVDPVPSATSFSKMYAKSAYHDKYYLSEQRGRYDESALLLKRNLTTGLNVLDYGCGVGDFLRGCSVAGLDPFGVEFDVDAANFASINVGCRVVSAEEFSEMEVRPIFDAIHCGDVLEHLPDPENTVKHLLGFLKPGGVLFFEGPLESNPSPVFWVARMYGAMKRTLGGFPVSQNAPTHLFRTNAVAQRDFFSKVDSSIELLHWRVFETGWPYNSCPEILKGLVSKFAIKLSGFRFGAVVLGNRFEGIWVKKVSH